MSNNLHQESMKNRQDSKGNLNSGIYFGGMPFLDFKNQEMEGDEDMAD